MAFGPKNSAYVVVLEKDTQYTNPGRSLWNQTSSITLASIRTVPPVVLYRLLVPFYYHLLSQRQSHLFYHKTSLGPWLSSFALLPHCASVLPGGRVMGVVCVILLQSIARWCYGIMDACAKSEERQKNNFESIQWGENRRRYT